MIFERPILDILVLEKSLIGGRSICSTFLYQASLYPSVPFNEVYNTGNPLQLLTPSLYHVHDKEDMYKIFLTDILINATKLYFILEKKNITSC